MAIQQCEQTTPHDPHPGIRVEFGRPEGEPRQTRITCPGVTESAEQRRARILDEHPDVDPFQYDSLVALGYEPESWDGFYRVPALDQPVQWMSPTSALVAEIVPLTADPSDRRAAYTSRNVTRIHWVHRTGWMPAHA